MATLRSLLVGRDWTRERRSLWLLSTLGLFAASFVAYAVDVFSVSGGLVWIPFHGAVLGSAAAAVVGYVRGGLVLAWLLTYAGELGYHADHAFLGLPRRTFPERLGYFLRPDGLAFLGVQAVVLGSLAFAGGAFFRGVLEAVRGGHAGTAGD